MYLVEHLLIGLVLSFIIYLYYRDFVLIGVALIFSVIPDLIDKPLGYLVWGSGRVIFHTVLIVAIFFIVAYIVKRRGWFDNRLFNVIWVSGLAIFVHQIMDAMWEMPRTWFWPLLGNFEPRSYDVMTVLLYKMDQELSQPNEICYFMAFLFGLGLMMLYIRLWYNT